jgi:DNA polymerase/3'-5' exonuclease PolX
MVKPYKKQYVMMTSANNIYFELHLKKHFKVRDFQKRAKCIFFDSKSIRKIREKSPLKLRK